MSNSDSDGKALPSQDNAKSPSVPLSVYRELAAELQATQAMLDSLHAQNKQLTRQNQQLNDRHEQLQREIANAVESVDRMKQIANVEESKGSVAATEASVSALDTLSESKSNNPSNSMDASLFRANVTEQPASSPPIWSTPAGNIDRKWSIAIVAAIVVAAFGAGYLYQVSVDNDR
ncbi:hypothetical protein IQ235_16680 [Oscillatoriales cyanobacterium LEGE 11467]|uniref:Uncharacterized protein n=1 Tax=Zarconia navalis LEGE 11467 TaxID=1828826 RepID=A0A928VY29_9CYAN|nr:DUF3450 domain-containing protein [Zarconia navalis]MBE9042409.1 hypothetical protein [Zarconia navalis LEGE 11467]